uniref:Probable RNA polymerase II nuclear localization protein SLC7A6OS n=1 Tax=Glossina austeni TaxID=7395 RepID=A0A1A9VQ35_GLOAU
MPAVVRVKRRIDEEPLSAFVLNGKRRRLADDNASFAEQSNGKIVTSKDEISTLLKFAGTLREQDDTATTEFARLTKTEAKEMVSQKSVRKPSNCTEKARQEMRQHLHEQRFRVVNCLRTTLEAPDTHENSAAKNLTIVDIEKQQNDKTATLNNNVATNNLMASTSSAAADVDSLHSTGTDSDTGYVYDLYLPDNDQQADYVDLMDDNYLRGKKRDYNRTKPNKFNVLKKKILALTVSVISFLHCYNNEDSDDKYDSEDSNEENYFANDYPDEDDEMVANSSQSEDEYDNENFENLSTAMNNFIFGKDDEETDSSSSSSSADNDNYYNSYEDPYIHTINVEDEDFCEDVDYYDADRYGVAYARYKARHIRKNTNALRNEENRLD